MDAQAVFQGLADPTRRRILQLLSDRELPAGDIAQHFEVSWPTVSRHLSVLKGAGLVTSRRSSRQVLYALSREAITTVTEELGSMGSPAAQAGTNLAGGATEQARQVFHACFDEAGKMHAERVGTHHLLLALLSGSEGTAQAVLQSAGVPYESARDSAVALFGRGERRPDDPLRIPFEWACKTVISGGCRGHAIKLGHRIIGTGVQLLALIDEVERSETGPPVPGKAARVLADLGVDLGQLRSDLIAEMNVSADDDERSALDPVLDELGSTHQLMWELFVGLESTLDKRFSALSAELQTIKKQLADTAP